MNAKHLAKALLELLEEFPPEEVFRKFLAFAEKRKLLSFLPRVVFYLEFEARKRKEKNALKISSSYEISGEIKNLIKKATGAKEPAAEIIKIKPELIGGFVAEYGEKIYDGSVKNQLKKLSTFLKKRIKRRFPPINDEKYER